jgi:hypothetical protein
MGSVLCWENGESTYRSNMDNSASNFNPLSFPEVAVFTAQLYI